jgi:hypothetical protein
MGPWPHYMILEVCWDGLWTLSFGLSQSHGHGFWLMCEVAVIRGPKLYSLHLRNKRYIWWNFSQTSPNELECCRKQRKCWCWWTTKSNNSLHLFNNWYLDSTASTHINAVLCASVPSVQNGGLPVNWHQLFFLYFTMDTPSSPESA